MGELIEKTFNPFYSQVYVIPHDLTGDGVLTGEHEDLISTLMVMMKQIMMVNMVLH